MGWPDMMSSDIELSGPDDMAAEAGAERHTGVPVEPRRPAVPAEPPRPAGVRATDGLARRLRDLRDRAGLSQRQLADEAGIDVTYLSKLENARQAGSERVLRALAEALHVPAADLLGLRGRVADEAPGLVTEMAPSPHRIDAPSYATSFINRADQMAHLHRVWRPEMVITVTGPPGCGKTRLVSEFTASNAAAGAHVAWLTVREDDDVERLAGELPAFGAGRGTVVVLDDADLSLSVSAEIARRVVRSRQGVTVLATSRRPLGLYGEQLLPLQGLAVPDRHLRPDMATHGLKPDLGRLRSQESVNLFIDRARLARPGFELDPTNVAAVFDVCTGLDGLPLAIELAALRLRRVTVVDLAAELDEALAWLAGNTTDVPHRHASLAAAIGWSFERLDTDHRVVAGRLSVFSAPFSRGDAADVAHDRDLPPERVRDIVLELVDHSLLLRESDRDGKAVYRWPHPIREYARGVLERAGDEAARVARDRYNAWFRRVLESVRDDPLKSEAEWARLASVTPDLYATVYRLPGEGQMEARARLAEAWSAVLQFGHGDSQKYLQQLLQEKEKSADVFRQAGILMRVQGDFEGADDHLRTAQQIALNERDSLGQANSLLDLAENAYDRGVYGDALDSLDRARTLYEELGNRRGVVEVQILEGRIKLPGPDPAAAEPLFQEAVRLAQEVEDRRLQSHAVQNLGLVDQKLRRLASARLHLEDSLSTRLGMGNRRGAARVIEAFALVESDLGNHHAALQLLGAARHDQQSRRMLGVPTWWQAELERIEEEARSELASRADEVERNLREGAAMSLEQAAELATGAATAVLRGTLGEPVVLALRRRVPERHTVAAATAALLEGGDEPTALDRALDELTAGKGSHSEVYRCLRTAELLALAEPNGTGIEDLASFAVSPAEYRGLVVPVFTRRSALVEILGRRPEWRDRPVVTFKADRLRPLLLGGETVVVNPWLATEYRFSNRYPGYLPGQDPDAEPDAPPAAPDEGRAA